MDTMTMNGEDVRHELRNWRRRRPCKRPPRSVRKPPKRRRKRWDGDHGGRDGTAAAVAAGGIGLVVGMFLGLAIVHTTRTHAY